MPCSLWIVLLNNFFNITPLGVIKTWFHYKHQVFYLGPLIHSALDNPEGFTGQLQSALGELTTKCHVKKNQGCSTCVQAYIWCVYHHKALTLCAQMFTRGGCVWKTQCGSGTRWWHQWRRSWCSEGPCCPCWCPAQDPQLPSSQLHSSSVLVWQPDFQAVTNSTFNAFTVNIKAMLTYYNEW